MGITVTKRAVEQNKVHILGGVSQTILDTGEKHCTEVCFVNFLSGGFTIMAVMNPLENKLEKRTSVQCLQI